MPDASAALPTATMFEVFACTHLGSDEARLCPGGVFDDQAFLALYDDPEADDVLYPDEGEPTLPYHRQFVRRCLDGSIPTPAAAGVDPILRTCDDGAPTIHCTDGTRPVAAVRAPAPGTTVNKWMISVTGGGDTCAGGLECLATLADANQARYSTVLSIRTPAHSARPGYLFVPEFNDYYRVDIEQCSGGRAIGVSTREEDINPSAVGLDLDPFRLIKFHHGARVTRAVLLDLKEQLGTPEQVVFVTQSNGSWGGYMQIDDLRAFVDDVIGEGTPIDVRLVAQSLVMSTPEVEGAFEQCYATSGGPCLTGADLLNNRRSTYAENQGTVIPSLNAATPLCGSGITSCEPPTANKAEGNGQPFSIEAFVDGHERLAYDTWDDGTGTILDDSCAEAHAADITPCLDPMHLLLFHVTTPMFINPQLYDGVVRFFTVNYDESDGSDYGLRNPDFGVRVRAVLDALGTPDGHRDAVSLPGHAIWSGRAAGFYGGYTSHWALIDIDKLTQGVDVDSDPDQDIDFKLIDVLRGWLHTPPNQSSTPVCILDEQPPLTPEEIGARNAGNTAIQADLDATRCFVPGAP